MFHAPKLKIPIVITNHDNAGMTRLCSRKIARASLFGLQMAWGQAVW